MKELPIYTGRFEGGITITRANPNLQPQRGESRASGFNAIRNIDNEIVDDAGNKITSRDNEAGLVTLDQPLTNFAVGYPGEGNLQQVLDTLAPVVPGAMSFQYFIHNEKEEWIDLLNGDADIRATGGDFPKLGTGKTRADGSVDEKGVTICIDHRMGGNLPAVRQAQVQRAKNILLRTEIRRVFNTLDDGLSAETSENWGAANTARDPDGSIITLLDSKGDLRGINSNLVVFGGGASLKRKKAYRAMKNAGSTLDYIVSPEDLAAEYEVDTVLNVNLRRQSTASAKAKIITDVVYGYYAAGTTPEDPSNIKRFVDVSAGSSFVVFVEEKARYTEITVWHASRIVKTSSLGIFKLPVTYTN
jgi:hypothetical protein